MMDDKDNTSGLSRHSSATRQNAVDEEKVVPSSQSGSDVEKSNDAPTGVEATTETPAAPVPPPNPFMDPKSFPDGGAEAWLVVFGGFFALFVSFGWINCIGIFQDYYQSGPLKQYSPSTIAWIPALETFMMFSGGPIVGKFYDNYGPRYILLTGTFLHVFGLMMISLCTEYYQFVLAQGICSPMGASMIFYPAVNCINTWFHRNRALATGVTVSGSSLGGVILPIMVQRLIPRIGFPWTMRAAAFLILGCLVISNLTIKSRIPPRKSPIRIMDFVEPLQERTFLLLTIASFFTFWGMFLPFTYIILQAQTHGMSYHLSQYLVPILNAASVFGRILPGAIGDRIGRYNMMVIVTTFTVIVTLGMWIPSTSNAAIIVFSALYGFGTGAIVSLPPALIAQISDVRKIGTRVGTLFCLISFAALTGSPIGGAIVTAHHGSYLQMQIFGGVVMAVGAVLFAAARVSLGGFNPATKV